ncbi:Uncharacterized protein TPAR_00773 [Tolypocladium paradoxum]|uniref:Uncharacterized protein n=1 Tax=Tolypocladium paradoxum TaxID=94208 RepID=A0A2S4L9G6_9HYPO|nr:Uncharacterized protein TPAR_00773 [Tolypocladium paradoxum]
MESSVPVEDAAVPQDASTQSVDESPGSVMNRRRAAKTLPSSFSSNLGNRNSPTASRFSRNDSPSPCEVPRTTGGRSVKSIVQWLEASREAPLASPKSILSGVKQNPATSTATPVQAALETERTIPHAPGVEDHSLAYLNYKKFFTNVPLGRCLDGVTEDLSKIPLEDIFKNAGKGLASEKTRVSLIGSADDAGEASAHGKAGVEAATEDSLALGKVVDTTGEAAAVVDSKETDVKSQGHHDGTAAAAEQTATSAKETPQVIQRDPREVEEFWGNVRSYLHISDDEIESNSAASESHEQPAALPDAVTPSLHSPTPSTDRPAPLHTPAAQREHSSGPGEDNYTLCRVHR